MFGSILGRRRRPAISFVVCVYDMVDQAMNTLYSLSADYQADVQAEDYEVIVVENDSGNNLEEAAVAGLNGNFTYILRQESRPTPVFAMNEGASRAQSDRICVMIDGARMLTPGVVSNLLQAHRLSPHTIVSVPGYHLGEELQQEAVGSGYSVDVERALLGSIGWPRNGYRLFEISCFSASCRGGYFLPHSESNCLSVPRHLWEKLGGFDPGFDSIGGGLANLDLYKRACEFSETLLVTLPGEGTFHQFHGGVTTGGVEESKRRRLLETYREQYKSLRGEEFSPPKEPAALFGVIPPECQGFVKYSADKVLRRRKARE